MQQDSRYHGVMVARDAGGSTSTMPTSTDGVEIIVGETLERQEEITTMLPR